MRLFIFLIFSCILCISINAYTIVGFGPSYYQSNTAQMNTTLGITDYLIEDFEDDSYIEGLSISYGYNNGTSTYYSNSSYSWEGNRSLQTGAYSSYRGNPIFNFEESLSSFGVGLTNMYYESSHPAYLYINGNFICSIQSINGFSVNSGYRNLYFRIDAEDGEVINSVQITTTSGDWVLFDHLAVQTTQIPEPTNILLILMSLLALSPLGRHILR